MVRIVALGEYLKSSGISSSLCLPRSCPSSASDDPAAGWVASYEGGGRGRSESECGAGMSAYRVCVEGNGEGSCEEAAPDAVDS